MPNVTGYKKGFGLSNGMVLAGYRLTNLSIEHDQVVRYRTYEYPTQMTWTRVDPHASSDSFIEALEEHVRAETRILSGYGNPYQCSFGELSAEEGSSEDKILITAKGVCHRVFN